MGGFVLDFLLAILYNTNIL